MYKKDLALKDQQGLICHKTQPNETIFKVFCVNTKIFYQNNCVRNNYNR